MSNVLNVGITDDNDFVQKVHIPLINANSSLKVLGIVASPEQHPSDLKIWPSIDAMLSDPDVHVVLVTSPLSSRGTTIKQALELGKHVMSEVPLAPTAAETSQLIEISKRTGRLLCPMFRHRYDGDYNTLSKLRLEKFGRPLGRWERWIINDLEFTGVGGDELLLERASRWVDQVHHFFGMPTSVVGRGREEGLLGMILEYEGLVVEINLGTSKGEPQYDVRGEKGRFEKPFVDPQFEQLMEGMEALDERFGREPEEHYGKVELKREIPHARSADEEITGILTIEPHAEPYPTIKTPTWKGLYADFALAVRGEHHNPCAPGDALNVQVIVEAARESASRGGEKVHPPKN